MTKALAIRQDRTLTTAEPTASDVFNIWPADQSKLIQTVYRAQVTAFLEWAGKTAQSVHIGDIVGYKQAPGPIGAWLLLPSRRSCRRSGASTKSAIPRDSRPTA